MDTFTYEKQDTGCTLETYEWDNIWWEHAPDTRSPRALVIGDSISCGYRSLINAITGEKLRVDGLGTSKALDHPCLMPTVQLVLGQQGHTELIQVNNGLHGWHLTDEQYEAQYRKLLQGLAAACKGAVPVLALTTPVRSVENLARFATRNEIVLRRNEIAQRLALQAGMAVNDLYTPLSRAPELFSPDGVHLTPQGYSLLAKQSADLFLQVLAKPAL